MNEPEHANVEQQQMAVRPIDNPGEDYEYGLGRNKWRSMQWNDFVNRLRKAEISLWIRYAGRIFGGPHPPSRDRSLPGPQGQRPEERRAGTTRRSQPTAVPQPPITEDRVPVRCPGCRNASTRPWLHPSCQCIPVRPAEGAARGRNPIVSRCNPEAAIRRPGLEAKWIEWKAWCLKPFDTKGPIFDRFAQFCFHCRLLRV